MPKRAVVQKSAWLGGGLELSSPVELPRDKFKYLALLHWKKKLATMEEVGQAGCAATESTSEEVKAEFSFGLTLVGSSGCSSKVP